MQVSEKCPSCGHLEAYYEEKQVTKLFVTVLLKELNRVRSQMRSADEGSTILYTVCHPAVRCPSSHELMNCFPVCILQTWMAYQQLAKNE